MINRLKQLWRGHKTIKAWIAGGGMLTSWDTAFTRTQTCLACPMNQRGGFWDWVARFFANGTPLPKRPENRRIRTCKVCHCALRVKIQMPLVAILRDTPPESLDNYPSNCWLHKETSE